MAFNANVMAANHGALLPHNDVIDCCIMMSHALKGRPNILVAGVVARKTPTNIPPLCKSQTFSQIAGLMVWGCCWVFFLSDVTQKPASIPNFQLLQRDCAVVRQT